MYHVRLTDINAIDASNILRYILKKYGTITLEKPYLGMKYRFSKTVTFSYISNQSADIYTIIFDNKADYAQFVLEFL